MTELIPGRFYNATVSGVPDVVIQIDKDGYPITTDSVAGSSCHSPESITNARQLVVLDLNTMSARRFAEIVREGGYAGIADQIEAQTKPARIPEPGLWGVVEAACVHDDTRMTFVLDPLGWAAIGHKEIRTYNHDGWDDLVDPVLIRAGIEAS